MIEAYPLYWPEDRPRTPAVRRESSRFVYMSFARARDEVTRKIEFMTGKYSWMRKESGIIVSTNVALRRDGLPLASQRSPDDPGVAVYFNYNKKQVCFACDRWKKIEDNMQAIAKTIDALRGISRWGTGDMMEAAFKGFTALPGPSTGWREVLDCPNASTLEQANEAYKRKRSETHPDKGGSQEQFLAINRAWAQAESELRT